MYTCNLLSCTVLIPLKPRLENYSSSNSSLHYHRLCVYSVGDAEKCLNVFMFGLDLQLFYTSVTVADAAQIRKQLCWKVVVLFFLLFFFTKNTSILLLMRHLTSSCHFRNKLQTER